MILILLLIGALPSWPYSDGWGYIDPAVGLFSDHLAQPDSRHGTAERLKEPLAVNGAPRSETKTWRNPAGSFPRSLRSARISTPLSGCTLSSLPLRRVTCNRPGKRVDLPPIRAGRANRQSGSIMAASRWP